MNLLKYALETEYSSDTLRLAAEAVTSFNRGALGMVALGLLVLEAIALLCGLVHHIRLEREVRSIAKAVKLE